MRNGEAGVSRLPTLSPWGKAPQATQGGYNSGEPRRATASNKR